MLKQQVPITTKQRYSKTILILPTLLALLWYSSTMPYQNSVKATQRALIFALLFSILISCIYLPHGLIQDKTRFLWKTITAISFVYLITLIYFTFLQKNAVMEIIKTYLDPKLKYINYEQVSYAQSCELPDSHIQSAKKIFYSVFDIFGLSHAIGWFVKSLVCRDLKLVFFCSLTFQLIQFSLRNVLNNFKECWWDHTFLDFFGCNLLGIIAGFYLIDYLKLDRYRWSMRDAPLKNNAWSQLKYFLFNWDLSALQMKSFSNLKQYIQLIWYIFLFQMVDLSLFFLKYVYNIPPNNWLVIFRVVIVGLLALNATKEYFWFITRKQRQIRVNAFLIHLIIFAECILTIKHGQNMFSHIYFTFQAKVCLGTLFLLVVCILIKVLISDIINWRKHQVTDCEQEDNNSEVDEQILLYAKAIQSQKY